MRLRSAIVAVVLLSLAGVAASVHAEVVIETVTVGNPGNAGEDSGQCVPGWEGPRRECGAVDYEYNLAKFEVTAGQYTEFLNAVAATDTYALYNTYMWDEPNYGRYCRIQQHGSPGSYSYSVAGDWADRPVSAVSWGDAARFANWLHNGQPTGDQDLTTTEDGSYYLDGATTIEELIAVVRKPDATWVIPSEDEWYKAAYHYNNGATGNYYDYPTSSDSIPSNDLIDPDPGNNANFSASDFTIGVPNWQTEVGEFENSDSPYGTFDQGGNVYEWNEAIFYGSYRGIRGGSYRLGRLDLHAACRAYVNPTNEEFQLGFRVAEIDPESICGDGVIEVPEECDDGNADSRDGCSSTCSVEDGWECSGEPSTCTEVCGDGMIVGSEECDDGNTHDCDGCRGDCSAVEGTCGDGTFDPTCETCDDGNTDSGDRCSSTCQVEHSPC
ncbi:MAG: DUF4215 domain-containing protein [Planctomycetota bacterium]|jgi:cysteine-rich repeat protein